MLSANLISSVLTVVVVPLTTKSPVTVKLPLVVSVVAWISSVVNVPSTVTVLNVTLCDSYPG